MSDDSSGRWPIPEFQRQGRFQNRWRQDRVGWSLYKCHTDAKLSEKSHQHSRRNSHMSQIRRFEDLEVWKLAMDCAERIYDASSNGSFSQDFALRNQIRSSGISIFSNIAEGFERDGNREFANFLSIAKGSCGEARAQLIFANRVSHISDQTLADIQSQLEETSRQLFRFRNYLLSSNYDGRKRIS